MTRQIARQLARQTLFWRFTVLAFLAFVAMSVFLIAAIAPAIESFIVTQQERDAVVFVNTLVQRRLSEAHFRPPLNPVHAAELEGFLADVPIRGVVEAAVLTPDGTVLATLTEVDPQYMGWVVAQPGFAEAVSHLQAFAGFEALNPAVSPGGIAEGLVLFIPLTLGVEETPVGVLHVVSRTGLLREAVAETEREVAGRIVLSLVGLYLLLSVIVWGASRTIVRQNAALAASAERLRQSLAREQELSAIKEKFVEVASHQLKTPVTEIGWALEVVQDPNAKKAEIAGALESIEHGHHSLQSVVFDLLTVTEIGFSYKKREEVPVRLGEITTRVVAQLAERAADARVAVRFSDPSGIPEVLGSPVALGHVVRNLLDNAITYSNPGGAVLIDIRREHGGVAWEVRDHGIGVPPEDRGSLFREFFRARNAVEKKTVGTGLGLFICKTVVEGHGGQIRYVPNATGVGSRFVFWLPERSA